MKQKSQYEHHRWSRAAGLGAAALLTAGVPGVGGCLSRPVETLEPRPTSTIFERLTQSSVDKIDLLLAIDNSRSMADKQDILALAVPDLVKGLVNPRCLDPSGVPSAEQPSGPLDPCPVGGTKREFEPVTDIHIGIISSSLGGHGVDNSCPDVDSAGCPDGKNTTNNDKGRLLSRTSACAAGDVPTYQSKGFLAWDPGQKLDPPGELDIETDANGDGRALVPDLREMVRGVGQVGCGYEAQLESWYRFLVDPEPYETISLKDDRATPEGIDQVLLKQRAEFLRPGSLLAIIMLSDENDCSIRDGGSYYLAAKFKDQNGQVFHLPRPRAECAKDPNDPCCLSCGQPQGSCPVDPTCYDANGNVRALNDFEDPANLRCFDQKRRFGLDFLYPIDRYTQALTSLKVPNRAGELVPNPLFSDLNPTDDLTYVRDPGLVFIAGIVGVPWQDIARRDAEGKPDLIGGLDGSSPPRAAGGYQTAEELIANNTWDVILGDPSLRRAPQDPFMIEAVEARSGKNPITGDVIGMPPGPLNPINGYDQPGLMSDLQYACIFSLLEPRDCSDPSVSGCECGSPENTSPLCDENPKMPGTRTLQTRAKAYPGTRELELLKGAGEQGIVASVCARQVAMQESPDFGYRPAIGAIIDRLKQKLSGQCLPRTLTPDETDQVPCLIVEARRVEEAEAEVCNRCEDASRKPVAAEHHAAVEAAKSDMAYATSRWNCFCEIEQAKGADLEACQTDTADPPRNEATTETVNGWCYVDATTTPPTGNEALVASCPVNEKRLIRFVGAGSAKPNATMFITCSGDTAAAL